MLVGMPAPRDLHRSEVDGQVFVAVGATVLFSYAADDAGLRNLAAVTLPEMGFTGRRVAQVLGITEEYVSVLRARTRREGSAGLMRRRGRPSALRAGDLRRARSWRAAGQTDAAIGDRLGVHATTVARALAGVERPGSAGGAEQTILAVPVLPEPVLTEPVLTEPVLPEPVLPEPVLTEPVGPSPARSPARLGSRPVPGAVAMPGRCCSTPTSTASAPRASSPRCPAGRHAATPPWRC